MMPTIPQPALTIPLADGIDIEFQRIDLDIVTFPGLGSGEFRMGSRSREGNEEPQHVVRLTRPFYLGTYSVTREQYLVFDPNHKNEFNHDVNLPVESVSWLDAMKYCQWLNETFSSKLPAGFRAGLPTEAQWEYACRGGIETEYYMGDGEAALLGAGWFDGNSGKQTQRVGQLAGNDFGLFDMHGNVWEFCLDGYDEDAYKQRVDGICDPYVPFKGDHSGRVFRGGGWYDSAWFCRSACRFWWRPDFRNRNQGFRACLFSGPCPRQQTGARAERGVGGDARRDDEARRQLPREASEFFGDLKFPSNE